MKTKVKEEPQRWEMIRWYIWLVMYVAVGLFALYVATNFWHNIKLERSFEEQMKTVAIEHGCEYLGQPRGVERVVLFNCKGKVLADLLDENK